MADEAKRIISIEELSSKVDKLFDMLGNNTTKTETKTEQVSGDVDSQVQKALADAKAKDEAASKEAATESRFKKLEELAEKKPVSYGRLTKFMWSE